MLAIFSRNRTFQNLRSPHAPANHCAPTQEEPVSWILSVYWFCLFFGFSINGIIPYELFGIWLLSLNIVLIAHCFFGNLFQKILPTLKFWKHFPMFSSKSFIVYLSHWDLESIWNVVMCKVGVKIYFFLSGYSYDRALLNKYTTISSTYCSVMFNINQMTVWIGFVFSVLFHLYIFKILCQHHTSTLL